MKGVFLPTLVMSSKISFSKSLLQLKRESQRIKAVRKKRRRPIVLSNLVQMCKLKKIPLESLVRNIRCKPHGQYISHVAICKTDTLRQALSSKRGNTHASSSLLNGTQIHLAKRSIEQASLYKREV